jgi:hypothetical protein
VPKDAAVDVQKIIRAEAAPSAWRMATAQIRNSWSWKSRWLVWAMRWQKVSALGPMTSRDRGGGGTFLVSEAAKKALEGHLESGSPTLGVDSRSMLNSRGPVGGAMVDMELKSHI